MADEDPLREMRTMILLSLPFPPIPVQAAKTDQGVIQSDDAVISTHDILAICLNSAAARGDQVKNYERRVKQREVLQHFLHALATKGFTCPDEELYHLYCEYSLLHITTYFLEAERPPEIRFMPLSYISKADPIHRQMCQYMAGQSRLFEDDPPLTTEYYGQFDYDILMKITCARIGHAITEEEKKLIENA